MNSIDVEPSSEPRASLPLSSKNSIQSKKIEDYIRISIEDLPRKGWLPVPLFLYFSKNVHLLIWKKAGDELSAEVIESAARKKMEQIWVYRKDWEEFLQFHRTHQSPEQRSLENWVPKASPPTSLNSIASPAEATPEKTSVVQEIMNLLEHPHLDPKKKAAAVALTARAVLAEAIASDEMDQACAVAERVAHHALTPSGAELRAWVKEIFEEKEKHARHSVHVATFVILFSLAFGKIEGELLRDIALSGLFHELGMCQIPSALARTRSQDLHRLPPETLRLYLSHLDHGLSWIKAFVPEVSERVHVLISRHHEKFDGSGYPQKLNGFQLDDLSQLLILGDRLEDLISGGWDGKSRSLQVAWAELKKLETERNFPQFFNPDLFSALVRWIETAGPEASVEAADRVRELMEKWGLASV